MLSTRFNLPSSQSTTPPRNKEDLKHRREQVTDKLSLKQDTKSPDQNYSHMEPLPPDSLQHLAATPATWQTLSHRSRSIRKSMEIQSTLHINIVRRRREPEVGNRKPDNIITIRGGGEGRHGDESPESTPPPSQSWWRLTRVSLWEIHNYIKLKI